MNDLKTMLLTAVIGMSAAFSTVSNAQMDERSYTEGSVVNVSYIRTEPGRFDDYMKYLATTYKSLMEEYKKSGVILDYAVYAVQPAKEGDADLILTITYKNYAALDGLTERMDPIAKKVWSTLKASNDADAERGKMRTPVGSQFIQRLILK